MKQRCRCMNGIHIECKILDFQLSFGNKTVEVVVFQGLHQLLQREIGIQVEVSTAVQLEVLRQKTFQIIYRHIPFHVEFETHVTQQVLDRAF